MFSQVRTLGTKTIALVVDVTDSPSWDTPWQDSQAGEELAAEESRPGRRWGSWPWLGALMIARLGLQVAVEEAKGFLAILDPKATSYAADVVCRAVLESSSLAWWLLDPDIGADKRLARCLAYRMGSAQRTLQAIEHLGLGPEEDRSEYGELPDDVAGEIACLGLTHGKDPRGRPSCDGEACPSYTDRVAALVGQVWPQQKISYALLSAVGHGEVLGLARSLGQSPGEAKPRRWFPDAPSAAVWIWHDTYLVLTALTLSAERAARFLNLPEQVEALRRWGEGFTREMAALRPAD